MKLIAIMGIVAVTFASAADAAEKPQPRRLEAGDLRANFRQFEGTGGKAVKSQGLDAGRACPEKVQIGGTTTPSGTSAPLRVESRTVIMDSRIAIFCGV